MYKLTDIDLFFKSAYLSYKFFELLKDWPLLEVNHHQFCQEEASIQKSPWICGGKVPLERHDMFLLLIQHLMSCLEIRITPTWGQPTSLWGMTDKMLSHFVKVTWVKTFEGEDMGYYYILTPLKCTNTLIPKSATFLLKCTTFNTTFSPMYYKRYYNFTQL